MNARRHYLVIATQCRSMPNLTGLAESARALSDVLSDDRYGNCRPGLPDGTALLSGELEQAFVEHQVRVAVEYAAERSATLVLALLGHGFVPGDQPTLYLMTRDSRENVSNTAVNVPALLAGAADRMAIAGVIALVDTCNAAAASLSAPELTSGARQGRTRLDLLMASAVQQAAVNFAMTRTLVELLRSGVGDAPTLGAETLGLALNSRIDGQNVTHSTFDGAGMSLWVGRNPRVTAASIRYGSYGYDKYRSAMRRAIPGITELPTVTQAPLVLSNAANSPARRRAEIIVRDLPAVGQTVEVLRSSLLRDAVTPEALRRAAPVPLPQELFAPGAVCEAEVVSYLALNPPIGDGGTSQLLRFVLTLADQAGRDLQAPVLQRWIDDLGLMVLANEVIAELRNRRTSRELRLIVSLHASMTGDWPEVVKAWTVHCDQDIDHAEYPCEATSDGIASAIFAAVDRAEELAEARDLTLKYVEVAAPTGLLLRWRPEEMELGVRLGLSHEVVLHWSDRFKQSPEIRQINKWLRERLRSDQLAVSSPFDWLDDESIRARDKLREQLRQQVFSTAVAMGCRPADAEQVLTLLLTFTPIVIWPDRESPIGDCRADLIAAWRELPGALLAAYRRRWRDESAQNGLADLRAVWDDASWLDFCRRMQWRPVREDS